MRALHRLLLTAAIAGAILALAALLRAQYPRLLARHWRGQLDTVPDDQARALLGQIGNLGEPGIPVLVEALGSQRESVAGAAKQTLLERLDVWTTLSAEEVSPKLLILADALAEQVPGFGPTGRRDAEDLATWLLRWRPHGAAADRARLIASCREVLEVTSLDRSGLAEENAGERLEYAGGGRPGEMTLKGVPDTLRSDRTTPSESPIADLARLPGGGLPIETYPTAPLPPGRSGESGVPEVRGVEPRPLRNSAATRLPTIEGYNVASQWDSGHAAAGTGPAAPHRAETATVPVPPGPSGPDSAGLQLSGIADDWTRVDTLELMRRLRTSGGDATARIRAELLRRGFTEVHLELARRLFDPDPEVRIELARRLPGLQSVDAAPWLLWLCEDKDAEVRLVAITLLATTGDPSLLRQVRQIAVKDPDPRIRRQAQRIAQKPAGARK